MKLHLPSPASQPLAAFSHSPELLWEVCWMTAEKQGSLEGKVWFCINSLAERPRFSILSQHQSKEEQLMVPRERGWKGGGEGWRG